MQKARWRRAFSWRDGRTGVRWRVARQVASEGREVRAGGKGRSRWSKGGRVAAEVIGAVGGGIGGRRGGGRRRRWSGRRVAMEVVGAEVARGDLEGSRPTCGGGETGEAPVVGEEATSFGGEVGAAAPVSGDVGREAMVAA